MSSRPLLDQQQLAEEESQDATKAQTIRTNYYI